MSQPSTTQLPPSTADPGTLDMDIDTVIYAFLDAVPEPTDEQVHQFAALLGIDFEVFEEQIFKLFGDAVEQEDQDQDQDETDVDTDRIDDPLDVFLISYFLLNPQPSEEQVHNLALMVNVPPEELEERIYSLLADLGTDDSESESEEADGPPGPDSQLDEDDDIGTEIEGGPESEDEDQPYDDDIDVDGTDGITTTNSFNAF